MLTLTKKDIQFKPKSRKQVLNDHYQKKKKQIREAQFINYHKKKGISEEELEKKLKRYRMKAKIESLLDEESD